MSSLKGPVQLKSVHDGDFPAVVLLAAWSSCIIGQAMQNIHLTNTLLMADKMQVCVSLRAVASVPNVRDKVFTIAPYLCHTMPALLYSSASHAEIYVQVFISLYH